MSDSEYERDCRELFEALARDFPPIRDLYDAHVQEYGELLGHVLMGDVKEYCIDVYAHPAGKGEGALTMLRGILVRLEQLIVSGNDAEKELINTGFLETLENNEPGRELASLLGPALRTKLDEINKDWNRRDWQSRK